MSKIDKFYDIKNLLQCPICGRKIRFHDKGYICKRAHRFDISAKGYVNFLGSSRNMKGYDSQFFQSRKRFFNYGFYDHIADELCRVLSEHNISSVVVDAGCGEGFYADHIAKEIDVTVVAFDIAADAVKIASRSGSQVRWMVADITHIPVKDGAADCILDVFTPANYSEFARILSDDGILIKVAPGAGHLKELREAAKGLIKNEEYSNEEVVNHFCRNFDLIGRNTVSRTMCISKDQITDLSAMTPLLFDADKSRLDCGSISEITVEAEILTGKKKAYALA